MIYSYLTYINSINSNNVGLIKELDKSVAIFKSESRQNIIINKHILIIQKIENSEKDQ